MYCRNCGQKLTLRFCENEGLIPYCDTCEKYVFPQFAVAVSMVVTNREQNKILLAKHVEDDDFILFAGYVKKGENAEKTVPREIKEELGVNVVKSRYMSSRYHSQRDVLMLNFIVVVEDNFGNSFELEFDFNNRNAEGESQTVTYAGNFKPMPR